MENEFLDRAQLDQKEAAEKKKKKKSVKPRRSNAVVQVLNGDFFTLV